MDFTPSPRSADLTARVRDFIDSRIEPVEPEILADVRARRDCGGNPWTIHPLVGELQTQARSQGLWNLFLPAGHEGPYAARFGTDGAVGLTNVCLLYTSDAADE